MTGSTRFDSTSEAWTSLGSAERSLSTSCSVFLRCQKAVVSSHSALLSSAAGVVIVCGPALTWGLYGVGRDSAGMGTMRVAAQRRALRVSRDSLDAPRGPRQPARARTRGNRRVFWLPNLGRARCVSRRAARPGAAADACAGVARRTRARCCHLVAVVLLASYCRRSMLSTA